MTQPNILFFMTDQQRADALGCSGGWLKTPNLDRIAGEGVRFSRCVTTTPICVPARVTLATGRYPHNNAVWNNLQYTLPEDASTWMRVIRDLGYRTSLFGKTHLHPHGKVDLRKREYLLHAYGLDDVNEIGGPRASANVGSHMTAMWEEKGLLEAYRADFKERFDNKPHVVRPSVLPLEHYWGLIYKMNFLAGAVSVPLIVRTPETAANGGRVDDALAENCDLGPTLVELAGGEVEYQQFAKSLVPAMNGSTVPHREDAISEIQGEVMLADARWKTAINSDGQVYLLFDLENDPDETRNLAGQDDYRDVEDSLRLRILERIARSQLKAP